MYPNQGVASTTETFVSQSPSIDALFEEAHTTALKAEDKPALLWNIAQTYGLLCDEQEANRIFTEQTKQSDKTVSSPPTHHTKIDTKNIRQLIRIGRSFHNGGCEKKARAWVQRAYAQMQTSTIKANEKVVYLWNALEFYIYLNDWEIVEPTFQEILTLEMRSTTLDPPLRVNDRWNSFLGRISYELEAGAKTEANITIKKLLTEIDQPDPPASPKLQFAELSRLQILAGDPEGAFRSLEKVVELRQEYLDLLIQHGDSEGIDFYTRRYASRNTMDLAWVARRQAEIGDVEGARQTLIKAMTQVENLHPDDRETPWMRIHQAASVLGDLDLAWEALRKFVGPSPETNHARDDIDELDLTVMMKYASQNFIAALVVAKQIDRARQVTQKGNSYIVYLTRLQAESGDVDGALQTLESLPKQQRTHLAPNDAKQIAKMVAKNKGLIWTKKWASSWIHVPELYVNMLLGIIEGLANPTSQQRRMLR